MSPPGILEGINADHRRIAAGWLNDLSHLSEHADIPPHIFPGLLMWMAGYFVACQEGDDAGERGQAHARDDGHDGRGGQLHPRPASLPHASGACPEAPP